MLFLAGSQELHPGPVEQSQQFLLLRLPIDHPDGEGRDPLIRFVFETVIAVHPSRFAKVDFGAPSTKQDLKD